MAFFAASVVGRGPSACTAVLRRALLDLREQKWWTSAVAGGELHLHARPTRDRSRPWKVEARLALQLRPGASLPSWAFLKRRWERMVKRIGALYEVDAGPVRAVRDADKALAVASRPTRWLLDLEPADAATWGAWAGAGGNLVTRFASWQNRRAKSDLTVERGTENRILRALTEIPDDSGAVRAPEPSQIATQTSLHRADLQEASLLQQTPARAPAPSLPTSPTAPHQARPRLETAARAAHERRLRKGDDVVVKARHLERFTRHGAYLASEIERLRVLSVQAGDDGPAVKIEISAGARLGEALGTWPASWFEPDAGDRRAA